MVRIMLMFRCFDVSRIGTSEFTHIDTTGFKVNDLTFRRIHAEELFLKAVCPNTLVVQVVKDTLMATTILTQLQLFVDGVNSGMDIIAILFHMQMVRRYIEHL